MDFEALERVVRQRRTTKPAKMNGQKVTKASIKSILQLADWAPTHGRTEPWRFIVFEGTAFKVFSEQHAALYRQHCPAEKFKEEKYQSLLNNCQKASHLIICFMSRTIDGKISELEEYAAVAAAIQNILLGAAALDIATIWSTGGMATKPEMKHLLKLKKEDAILGFLYLGHSDESKKEGFRKMPLEDKIIWR